LARLPIAIPPGVFKDGTAYQGKGQYIDAWGTRWYGLGLGPINGWRIRKSDAVALTGAPRAALAWRDNLSNSWLGIGTDSNLYVSNLLGAVFDITPTDSFTAGRVSATGSGGYGSGTYGSSTYGTPRAGNSAVMDATQWTLAPWGEDLLAVSPDDGKLRQWVSASGTSVIAVTVANSPACKAVCVTPKRFVFALATDDPRTVSWCDQEDNEDWTPSNTNQAGSFPLQTAGRLMCGCSVEGVTLFFTDLDVFAAQYIGGTLIFSFDKVGDQCGAISRQSVAPFGNGQSAWMSDSGFWQWNGSGAVPLPCTIMDYIRTDINLLQKSKFFATVNSPDYEIEWRYCSSSSVEIDRCVVWNYRDNYWTIGRAARTCGADKGAGFQYPTLISIDGFIYDHEIGWDYGGMSTRAKTGPMEIGNGDNIMHILGLYPDEATSGDAVVSFTVRRNPDDPGIVYGPYSLQAQTDLRFSGGLIEMEVSGNVATNWRWGQPRLEVMQGEGR
jgi:hypothetical protein